MTYWVLKAILTPILRFFFRVRVEGLENVPADGPAILASNHLSFSDSVFLPLVVYALWPRIAAWASARGLGRRIPRLPNLSFIEGGVAGGAAPATAPAVSQEGDPPLRSAG